MKGIARRIPTAGLLLAVLALGCGKIVADRPTENPTQVRMTRVRVGSGGRESYLFVANQYFDVVSRVDMETLDVKNIAVGRRPYTMDVTPDGRTVVVADRDSRNVSLIDAARGEEFARVYTGFEPLAVAIASDGRYAGVANFTGQSVALVDVGGRGSLPLFCPDGPASVAFTADGSKLLAVSWYSPALRAWDTRSQAMTLEKVFEPADLEGWAFAPPDSWSWHGTDPDEGPRLQALAAGLEGSALEPLALVALKYFQTYVYPPEADPYRSYLLAVNWSNGHVAQALELPDGAFAAAFGPDGSRAYVLCQSPYDDLANVVSELGVAPDGTIAELFRYPLGQDPTSLAANPQKPELYVVNRGSDTLSVVYTTSHFQDEIALRAKPFTVSVSPSGRKVFVSHDNPLGSLSVIDSGSRQVRFFESLIYGDYLP